MARKSPPPLRTGVVYLLDGRAGIQFRIRPFHFLLEKELDEPTWWEGTTYVTGNELDEQGLSVAHRTLYVIRAALFEIPGQAPTPGQVPRAGRRARR